MLKTRHVSEFLFDQFTPEELAQYPRWHNYNDWFTTEERQLYLSGKDVAPTTVPVLKLGRLISKEFGIDSEPTTFAIRFIGAVLTHPNLGWGVYYERSNNRPEGDYEIVFMDYSAGVGGQLYTNLSEVEQKKQSLNGLNNIMNSGEGLVEDFNWQNASHNVRNLEFIFWYTPEGSNPTIDNAVADLVGSPNNSGGAWVLLEQVA